MTYKTHTAFAVSVALLPVFLPKEYNIYSYIDITYYPFILLTIIISSLVPDLDEPGSYLSRQFPFNIVSLVISSFVKHRGATHRLISCFIYASLFSLIILYNKDLWILIPFAFYGYFMHLMGDGFTVSGIRRFFYPISTKTFYFLPKSFRFKTGSTIETIWFLFFSLLIIYEIYFFYNYFLTTP